MLDQLSEVVGGEILRALVAILLTVGETTKESLVSVVIEVMII